MQRGASKRIKGGNLLKDLIDNVIFEQMVGANLERIFIYLL